MRLYPDVPARRRATILSDLAVLIAIAVFAGLAWMVYDTVDGLTALSRGAGDIPVIGGLTGIPGNDEVQSLARLLAALTFGLPTLLLLANYLPGRLTQARRLTDAASALRGDLTPERQAALAARAAYSLPFGALLRHTRDPLGDLAAGRYEPLVAALMEDAGLRRR